MNKAYSLLTVKSVDESKRIIKGIASTPAPDRVGDIVEPMGAKFKTPMPLLLHHRHDSPVGLVKFAKPTKDGIPFEAEIPVVLEEGAVKDRVDEAWQSVKHGLIGAVSIGFRAVEDAIELIKGGGLRFKEWEWLELSLVTVPANPEAVIQSFKSMDVEGIHEALGVTPESSERDDLIKRIAASGTRANIKPRAGGVNFKQVNKMKTVAEQIADLEATRGKKVGEMESIMKAAGETGETLDAAQSEQYDTLEAEVDAIDKHLERARKLEKAQASNAKPVQPEGAKAADAPAKAYVTVKNTQKHEPGIQLARVVKCLGIAQGNRFEALEIAKNVYGDNDAVVNTLKNAVAAGSTSNAGWAGNLVGDETSVFADFVEYLRPQTILGRMGAGGIPSPRRVPFRTPLVGQTSGGAGYWVGEGKGKPLTKFDFDRKTLEPLKVANIAVLTEEVIRDSSPSAEVIVRDQLVAALRERLDIDFIDPAKAAAANVSPASITYGVIPIASVGPTANDVRCDIKALMDTFIAANNAPTNGVFIMSSSTALALSLMLNPLGQPEFPGVTMNGGTLFGLPVLTSQYVEPNTSNGAYVVLVNASDIYLADEGGFSVDLSREASLQMVDGTAATQNAIGSTQATVLVSLWQTNCVGFRAERTINWMKRRDSAVALLDGVEWGACSSS